MKGDEMRLYAHGCQPDIDGLFKSHVQRQCQHAATYNFLIGMRHCALIARGQYCILGAVPSFRSPVWPFSHIK